MVAYSGAPAYCGIGIGANVTPTVYIPYETVNPKTDMTEITPKEHRGRLNTSYNTVRTYADGKFDLKGVAYPEMGLEHLLFAALGTKNSTQLGATVAYEHTITEHQSTRPVITAYTGLNTTDATILPEKFANGALEKLSLSIKDKEELKVDASFIGTAIDLDTAKQTATYATNPIPFVFPQLSFKTDVYGGTGVSADTRLTEFQVDITNNYATQQIANGSMTYGERIPTEYSVSGKCTLVFDGLTEYKKWYGAANATSPQTIPYFQNMQVGLLGKNIESTHNYQLLMNFPKVQWTDLDFNRDDDIVKYSFSWVGLEDNVTNKVMDAKVVSRLTAIA
jgi:hypothetical protein